MTKDGNMGRTYFRLSALLSSFDEKSMGRSAFVLCVGLMLAACGIHEMGESVRDTSGGIWTGPGMNVGTSDPSKTVCYVTALDYQDGYDWRSDREKGSVKCSLVVFADGIPMMKVPVGDAYHVSSDADSHRMIDGHLYTDFSTDDETIIKKDGKEVFRYPGREFLQGMIVDGEDIYTLGHSRAGEGFSYRKNGEILLEKSSGRTFSRLHRDGDHICFAYSEPIGSGGGSVERYYCVVDGVPQQAALREDVKKVWDLMMADGQVCYIASLVGVQGPVLFRGESKSVLTLPQASSLLTGRLSVSQGVVCVEGLLSCRNITLACILWKDGEQLYFNTGTTVASWCVEGDGVFCVMNSKSPSAKGVIYRCGDVFEAPLGYVSVGENTMALTNGILNVGLSSGFGGWPVLWKDGTVDTLKVNGYISSVTAGKRTD